MSKELSNVRAAAGKGKSTLPGDALKPLKPPLSLLPLLLHVVTSPSVRPGFQSHNRFESVCTDVLCLCVCVRAHLARGTWAFGYLRANTEFPRHCNKKSPGFPRFPHPPHFHLNPPSQDFRPVTAVKCTAVTKKSQYHVSIPDMTCNNSMLIFRLLTPPKLAGGFSS